MVDGATKKPWLPVFLAAVLAAAPGCSVFSAGCNDVLIYGGLYVAIDTSRAPSGSYDIEITSGGETLALHYDVGETLAICTTFTCEAPGTSLVVHGIPDADDPRSVIVIVSDLGLTSGPSAATVRVRIGGLLVTEQAVGGAYDTYDAGNCHEREEAHATLVVE